MGFKNISIISGGQSGVDRAALDFALASNISCGGYCPNGRIAEDGTIPEVYPLKETLTSDYSERTRKNIEECDGILILYHQQLDKGTKLTIALCKSLDRHFIVNQITSYSNKQKILEWIETNKIERLNIAGPRESSEPGIFQKTLKYLEYLFG